MPNGSSSSNIDFPLFYYIIKTIQLDLLDADYIDQLRMYLIESLLDQIERMKVAGSAPLFNDEALDYYYRLKQEFSSSNNE